MAVARRIRCEARPPALGDVVRPQRALDMKADTLIGITERLGLRQNLRIAGVSGRNSSRFGRL
jgi:hypothetical protein